MSMTLLFSLAQASESVWPGQLHALGGVADPDNQIIVVREWTAELELADHFTAAHQPVRPRFREPRSGPTRARGSQIHDAAGQPNRGQRRFDTAFDWRLQRKF